MANDFLDYLSLDYRLNGFSVNRVMEKFRDIEENLLEENMKEYGTKNVFNKALQILNLKKEFTSFAKKRDASEEESYAPFFKERVSELLRNADKWAKIFETEKEDRTNKKT